MLAGKLFLLVDGDVRGPPKPLDTPAAEKEEDVAEMACGRESIKPTSSTNSTIELLIFRARSARAHLSKFFFSDCGLYNDRLHARGKSTFNFFFF